MSGAKKKSERRAQQAELGLTERQKQELKTAKTKRRNTILAIVGGVVAVVLVAALLIWNSGVIARHTTALTVGDHKLSVADMDYYYYTIFNNESYNERYKAEFYAQNNMPYTPSFDYTADLKTQYVDEEQTQSYYDLFREQAKENAIEVCALYDAAKAAGYTLSEEAQAQLDEALTSLDQQVSSSYFGSRNAYLQAVYGHNVTEGVYLDNLKMSVLASDYYNHTVSKMQDYSDEELQAYYDENPGALDSYDYDYAILYPNLTTTDAEGNDVEVSDEERAAAMAQAKEKAESLLRSVQEAAEGSSFSDLAAAMDLSVSPRVGVLGVNFASSPYAEWLMDSARKDGDTQLFELEGQGYYVVQFHKRYLDNDPTVDVRHILASFADEVEEGATPEQDANGQAVYTAAQKQAAHDKAAAWLEEYNAGDKTAEAFGALAEEHSADGRNEDGSLYKAGGLYEDVFIGQMVKPFEDWCFDAARQEGDTDLVETSYGWHVMYYQAYHRPAWMDKAAQTKSSAEVDAFMESAKAGYEGVEGSGWSKIGSR